MCCWSPKQLSVAVLEDHVSKKDGRDTKNEGMSCSDLLALWTLHRSSPSTKEVLVRFLQGPNLANLISRATALRRAETKTAVSLVSTF